MNLKFFFRNVVNEKWIREIDLNYISSSRVHFSFTICFVNSPCIHYLLSKITIDFLFSSNSLSTTGIDSIKNKFSWIHYWFTIFFAKSTMIYYHFANLFEFPIFFANSFLIHYRFRKITFKSLSISRIHLGFIIFLAYSEDLNS